MGRVLAVAGAVAIVLSLALPASAHDKAFKSRVTIEHEQGTPLYEGDVFSGSRACVRRRVVQFWFDNTAGPDELLDERPASRDGHWRFEFAGSCRLGHELIDPLEPGADPALTYPLLLGMIEGRDMGKQPAPA